MTVISSDEQRLAAATKNAVKACGGLKVAADETGLSNAQLSRCGSGNEADSLTLRSALIIDNLTHGHAGHPLITQAMCRVMGGMFIPLPEGADDGAGIMQTMMEMASELGDVASSITDALRDDIFKPSEALAALEQLTELDQASAKLRLKLNSIVEVATTR